MKQLKSRSGNVPPNRSKWTARLLGISLAVMLLAGCSSIQDIPDTVTQWFNQTFPKTGEPAGVLLTTPTPLVTEQPTASTQQALPTSDGPQTLTIWVPPQFDPESGSTAGDIMKAQLAAFVQENPDVLINVRVKAVSGSSSLLDSLNLANATAKKSVPNLIALPRENLESAVLKELIVPVDEFSHQIDDSDWYEYARQLTMVQGTVYGLPFAGDALALLYRPEKIGSPPDQWTELIKHGQPILFPAADTQALFPLNLYLSTGASLEDSQNRPYLEAETLVQVLELIQSGTMSGSFPAGLNQYLTDNQSWQAYREMKGDMVITWISRYLSELPADTAGAVLPSYGPDPYSTASGWVWCLTNIDPAAQDLSIKLAEKLVETDFLAALTQEAGFLPTRPSTLTQWSNANSRNLASEIIESTRSQPRNMLIASVGPAMEEAVIKVLLQQSDPDLAAQAAVERLNTP